MNRIVGFIGLCKNVGKTTFLNRYIQNKENYLITSIGWDGEAIDHIFGIKKPSIVVKKGNLICTYSKLSPSKSAKLFSLPIENPFLGKLEIYQMIEDDVVQLAGPSSVRQFQIFLEFVQKNTSGIQEIIVDGAADRRIALSFSNEVFFIIGPTFSQNPQKIIKTILGIIKMFHIPMVTNSFEKSEIVLLNSLNKSNTSELDKSKTYVLQNLGKIIIEYEYIPQILKDYKIIVEKKPDKYWIVLNSFNAELMQRTLDTKKIIAEIQKISTVENILEM
ncbi:MAG: hypothetical protein RMJ51_01985 [Candidatus Calescibacterium sp.]|nr:hypothetical protein [Candidatus Calescibacterium sp.]MCX7971902.1 hypothetical protein [bacterium]MDW8194999.1 hypothetical protein [Candidatus Calescibacterium sp.]